MTKKILTIITAYTYIKHLNNHLYNEFLKCQQYVSGLGKRIYDMLLIFQEFLWLQLQKEKERCTSDSMYLNTDKS